MITSHSGAGGEGTPSDAEQTVSLFLELLQPQKRTIKGSRFFTGSNPNHQLNADKFHPEFWGVWQ